LTGSRQLVAGGIITPAMQFYTVIFEKDGEMVARFHTQAADEADAQAQCLAFFRAYPEEDPGVENPDLMIRVESRTG
jgi:hypothetical protein